MTILAELWQLWLLVFRTLPLMLTDIRYLMVITLVFYLVHGQYRRIHLMQKQMFGMVRGSAIQDTLQSLGYGIVGGLLATVVFLILGISLSDTGIIYLWLTAIVLMMLDPRFLCFAYAGGLVSVSALLLGFPKVDVPAIMALVAVLHLVEAVLIRADGYHKATPVYVKHANQQVVGAFSIQRFWPLPFVALLGVVMMNSQIGSDTMAMPDWWPLLTPSTSVPSGHSLVFILAPVMAALGYSDIAITNLPRVKAAQSSTTLLIFSGALLGLALLADRYAPMMFVAALFAPVGHEWIVRRAQNQERHNAPVFTRERGLMVLDVFPDSPAEQMGLRPGDVITCVNDIPIRTPEELSHEVTPWMINPVFQVENPLEGAASRTIQFRGKIPPIGIIPVPSAHQAMYLQIREGVAKSWVSRLFNKRRV